MREHGVPSDQFNNTGDLPGESIRLQQLMDTGEIHSSRLLDEDVFLSRDGGQSVGGMETPCQAINTTSQLSMTPRYPSKPANRRVARDVRAPSHAPCRLLGRITCRAVVRIARWKNERCAAGVRTEEGPIETCGSPSECIPLACGLGASVWPSPANLGSTAG